MATAFTFGGTLDANIESEVDITKTGPEGIHDSNFSIALSRGFYGGGHKLAGGLLVLPPLTDTGVVIKGDKIGRQMTFEELKINSSLGEASGSGEAELTASHQLDRYQFSFDIRLTTEGKSHFGGYLALAANKSLNSVARNWSVELRGRGNQTPQVIVREQ